MILKMQSEIWTGGVKGRSVLGKKKGLEAEKSIGPYKNGEKAESKVKKKRQSKASQNAIPGQAASAPLKNVRNAISQATHRAYWIGKWDSRGSEGWGVDTRQTNSLGNIKDLGFYSMINEK